MKVKYYFPQGEWNSPKDCIDYFNYYFKERFGKYIPRNYWGRYCKQVDKQIKEGHTYEDMQYVVWGVLNFENKCSSLPYCFYFWNKLDDYKKMKEEFDNKEDKVEEKVTYKKENKTAEDRMKESQKKLLDSLGI